MDMDLYDSIILYAHFICISQIIYLRRHLIPVSSHPIL